MADYMNYGVVGSGIPIRIPVETNLHTLVYRATHKGEEYLPFMYRSFISFSFGGVNIEDFNLLASIDGDRLLRDGYAPFNDLTSSYDVLHGQEFWGSYYTANSLNFVLATDAIDQRELDNFLHWFLAGVVRELILSEHPNRAIMARVALPPHLSLLPFEKQVSVRLKLLTYKTSTTLYKGTIELTLVMDLPHWYGKINIFGLRDSNGIYRDTWIDANGNERHVLDNPDALKILYEDGIPTSNMITSSMILGGNVYAIVENQVYSNIISLINVNEYDEHSEEVGYYNNGLLYNLSGRYYKGAVIFNSSTGLGARIAGAIMSEGTGIENLIGKGEDFGGGWANFYYAGTAPSPVILKFTLTPEINDEGYISKPYNKYALSAKGKPYNVIGIEGINKKEFIFTTPNILTSYNLVIEIFNNSSIILEGLDWAHVRELIRETVNHAAVRAWANRVIDFVDAKTSALNNGDSGIIHTGYIDRLNYFMALLFKRYTYTTNLMPMKFTFNSETGEATARISYRSCIDLSTGKLISLDLNEGMENYCIENIVTTSNPEENVGDMVKSKFLIIEERNYPNNLGNIVAWQAGYNYAHRLYHNVPGGLLNVSLEYKNMYL